MSKSKTIMTTKNSNHNFLTWTYDKQTLLAETTGKPIRELEMDCHIGIQYEGRFIATPAKSIWDTGTSTTAISTAIAAKLGLQPVGMMRIHGMGGTKQVPVCVACFVFPNRTAFGPIHMVVHDMPSTDVLIGMDIITAGKFSLEHKPDGGTRFTFSI